MACAKRLDGGWGWMVVAASFGLCFLCDGIRYSYGLMYVEFLREFQRGKGETSWVGSIMFGTYNLSGPIASIVIGRYGCRFATILGCTLTFTSYIISMFATSLVYLYFSYGILGGFGFVLMMLPFNIIIVEYFEKKRSLAMGIAMCGTGVGTIVFNPLSKVLIDQYQWRATLLIEAGMLLNGIVCGWAMQPLHSKDATPIASPATHRTQSETMSIVLNAQEKKHSKSLLNSTENASNHEWENKPMLNAVDDVSDPDRVTDTTFMPNGDAIPNHKGQENAIQNMEEFKQPGEPLLTHSNSCKINSKTFKDTLLGIYHFELLMDGAFLVFMISVIFIGLAFMVPFTYLPDLAISLGFTRGDAALILAAIGVTNTIFRIPAGVIGDRKWLSRWHMYVASILLTGISIACMPLFANYYILMTSSVIFGLSTGVFVVLFPLVIADVFGQDMLADSFGLILFGSGISVLVGPPLSGWVFDETGNYFFSFIIAGAEFFMGGVVLFLVPCLKREPQASTSKPGTIA